MIKGGTGGGNTKSGLIFEERVDLITIFEELEGYQVINTNNKSFDFQIDINDMKGNLPQTDNCTLIGIKISNKNVV